MSLKLATNALHAGHDVTQTQGTRAVPIYQTSSYVFNDSDHAANLFALAESGYIYTRLNNPTNDVLEHDLGDLPNGATPRYLLLNSIGLYQSLDFWKFTLSNTAQEKVDFILMMFSN